MKEKLESLPKLCVLFPWEYSKDVELCQYHENTPKGERGQITSVGPLGIVFSESWFGTWQ